MKLSLFIKIMTLVVILVLVSLVVNARSNVFAWRELWQTETFKWIFIATMGLLLGYASWISFCQFFWNNDRYVLVSRYSPYRRLTFYLLTALLPVIFVHTSLLQVVLAHYSGVIYKSSYWRLDFPYFIVPVLMYTILAYRWPGIFNVLPRLMPEQLVVVKKEVQIQNIIKVKEVVRIEEVIKEREIVVPDALLKSWLDERNPMFLLRYLRAKFDQEVVFDGRSVRYMDIVFIEFTTDEAFIYLANGEKIFVELTSSALQEWKLADWFFQVKRGRYVNMLYVCFPIVNKKVLNLDRTVYDTFLKVMEEPELTDRLEISRKLQDKDTLTLFENNRYDLTEAGWEETWDMRT
ncbi:MAG TPA: hypothetical protein VKZ57_10240 [Sphingobacterium sp.]|nr:hypothetical protein [Sphingobacterium sp.]